MAKVTHLDVTVIKGFRGQIDFYYWRGQAVARRWPKHSKIPATAAQLRSREWFIQSRADLRLIEDSVRALWPNDFFGRSQAWLDFYTGTYLRYCKLHGEPPPVVQSVRIVPVV